MKFILEKIIEIFLYFVHESYIPVLYDMISFINAYTSYSALVGAGTAHGFVD